VRTGSGSALGRCGRSSLRLQRRGRGREAEQQGCRADCSLTHGRFRRTTVRQHAALLVMSTPPAMNWRTSARQFRKLVTICEWLDGAPDIGGSRPGPVACGVRAGMWTVTEICLSIEGESTPAGRPCVFVRLTACDLRCSWCDTPYA